jgi:hypothetical protein
VIGTDPRILGHLESIFTSMWLFDELKGPPKLSDAIDLFGWQLVREIVLVVFLHEVHVEASLKTGVPPEDMDRRALAVLTGAVELKASNVAALLANVGEAALALYDASQYKPTRYYQIKDPTERLASEKATFGFDHGVLASYMLSEVDFPPEICDEIFEHTTIGTPIWIAEQLADDVANLPDARLPGSDNPLWQRLGFPPTRLARLRKSIRASGELPYLVFADSVHKAA